MFQPNTKHILILGNSEDFTFSAGEYLRQKGFDIDLAFSLKQGKTLISESTYDLVLIDTLFLEPDAEELAFIRTLKKNNLNLDIILITGFATLDSTLQSIKQGVADYLIKPFKFEELFESIKTVLEKREKISNTRAKEKAAITHYLSTALSHEINNPLTAILGYAQFLLNKESGIDQEAREIISVIERQARRIKEITHCLRNIRELSLVEYIGGTKMMDIHQKNETPLSKRSIDKKSILIVDDEQIVRDLLRDILTEKGHDTAVAKDGREALKMYNSRPFDLVMLDIKLPDMSGLDVLRSLKAKYQDVKIVIITGLLDDRKVAQAIVDGAIGHILKPFQIKDIMHVIESAFSDSEAITRESPM